MAVLLIIVLTLLLSQGSVSGQDAKGRSGGSIATEQRRSRTDSFGDPLPADAVARMGSVRLYHGGYALKAIALAPDGKLVVSTDRDGQNKLWDVATGRELPLRPALQSAFVFVARDKLLASARNRLWDLETGSEISSRGIDVLAAERLAAGGRERISPDGTIVAVCADLGIKFLDTKSRKELPPLKDQPREQILFPPRFSPDGNLLAVSVIRPWPGIWLWDLESRQRLRWLRAKDSQILDMAFSKDGKLVAAADGRGVTLWRADTGKWLHNTGHTYCIDALTFTPDRKTLITGAFYHDPNIRTWDTFTGNLRGEWKEPASGILTLAITPDGKHVASNGYRVLDLSTGKEVSRLGNGKSAVLAMSYSPNGKMLALGEMTGISLCDAATGQELRFFGGGTILHLAFAPNGKWACLRRFA